MNRKRKITRAVRAATAALSVFGWTEFAHAAIYSDNFDRATLNGGVYTYTVQTTGPAPTPPAVIDGGAFTDGSLNGTASSPNVLTLTNDITTNSNASGIVYVSTPTSAYDASFNSTLSANSRLLTWTLNMQQIRANPSGFGAGNYGAAYVLGATDSNFADAGSGYAVIIGNTGTSDPIRLFRYTSGLSAVGLSGLTATTAGAPIVSALANAGTDFWSVKVTYDSATNEWSLYTRDDGLAFGDPADPGGYSSPVSATDSTYTAVPLTYSGVYWAFATAANQTARFDNFQLAVPEPATALAAGTLAACMLLGRTKRSFPAARRE